MNYVPLYIKTDNSLLSSLIRIEDLILYAKENNIKTLTITDQNMYGVMDFYHACQNNGIKPIVGLEITIEKMPILLYCKNYQGYQNLLKLETLKSERELSLLDLTKYHSDLICIIPFNSLSLLSDLKKIFIELYAGYANEEERKQLSKNVEALYCNPILYIEKKMLYIYNI